LCQQHINGAHVLCAVKPRSKVPHGRTGGREWVRRV